MPQMADHIHRSRLKALLEANAPIPAKLVEELIASDDREDQADAFYCLSERWGQIRPEREVWATAPFVLGFLMRSITEPRERTNPDFECFESLRGGLRVGGHLAELIRPSRRYRAAARARRANHQGIFGRERIGARLHRNRLPGARTRAPRPTALVRTVEESSRNARSPLPRSRMGPLPRARVTLGRRQATAMFFA